MTITESNFEPDQEGPTSEPVDGRLVQLKEVARGTVSVTDTARELGLGDAGHALALMRQAIIPVCLDPLLGDLVKDQADSALEDMRAALIPHDPTVHRNQRC